VSRVVPESLDQPTSVVDLLLQWPVKVVEEVVAAPWTIALIRRSLGELPSQIDRLESAVSTLSSDLTAFRHTLGEVLPDLSRVVSGMDDRVGRVEALVADLGEVLTSVIGVIPGVRRALREPRNPL
jgi:ABC-type transporter Mla subunit MlaD